MCLLPGRVVGVWCLRYWCVRLLVFALLVLARLLGVVGQCGPAAPCPCSAWLVGAHALVWAACWRVRGSVYPMGGGRQCWGGT